MFTLFPLNIKAAFKKANIFLFCFFIIFSISNNYAVAVTHPIWNPGGDINTLKENVKDYINLSDEALINYLDNTGKNNSQNAAMVFITYDFALLYHLTGDTNYAHKAAILLNRYAEVFPQWPLDYSDRLGHYMWWDNWFHRDLGIVARYLAQAYDLVANSNVFDTINSNSRENVKTLLQQIVQVDLGYKLFIFNAAGTRPLGLIIFGRVLDDPELVHLGYWYYNKFIHELFCYDGFTIEGTYEYGAGVVRSLTSLDNKFYFDGYSDPPGFEHKPYDSLWDTKRIDNLNFDNQFKRLHDRMNYVLWKTALPNNQWPIMNETFVYPTGYSSSKYDKERAPLTNSLLMGGIGHAALTSGFGDSQTQVRLDFSHAISHSHQDALHLIYFSKGKEVIGGTGYNEGDRAWNSAVMNQNLVVINATEQHKNYWTDRTNSPYIPGKGRIQGLPESVPYPETNLHNNIILFEPGYKDFKDVQVVEADAIDAYSNIGAKRYQRMLALVKISETDEYLIDFFSVKGGTQYDWCIHGGHTPYRMSTNLSMNSTTEKFGEISIHKKKVTNSNWYGVINYSDVKHRFIMCGEPNTTVLTGEALKSVKEGGLQDYIIARRSRSSNTDENFLVVHETYNNSPHILSVEKLTIDDNTGSAAGIKIKLDNGITDYIVHTLDEGPNFPEHIIFGKEQFALKGKYAHIRVLNDKIKWLYLLQGQKIEFGSQKISSKRSEFSYRGLVTGVNRIEEGQSDNSFIVDTSLPAEGLLDGKTLIITWANGWKWGYKIKQITGNKIIIEDEAGFNYDGKTINMHYFPVGVYNGPISFIIPGTAIFNANGELVSTEVFKTPDSIAPANPTLEKIKIIK